MTYKFIKNNDKILIHIFKFSNEITQHDHDQFMIDLYNCFKNEFYVIFDLEYVTFIEMSILLHLFSFQTPIF
jgi:anti-anti-sigma regulatory factor